MTWALVLHTGAADVTLRVAGLPLITRLALDAQAAGAQAVALSELTPEAQSALNHPKLTLPIEREPPAHLTKLHVAANAVVHRGLFKAIVDAGLTRDLDLREEPFTFDPPWGFNPISVTDDTSRRRAEAALFRSLRKPQDGWTSRYLNRYLSLAISRLLVKTPLRPNQLSVLILAIGLAGAALATRGDYLSLVLGALLFQAQSVLDGCDGEMSRVTHQGSLLGEWLDTIGDDLTNYGFFAGAAWGLYTQTGSALYLITGGVTLACGVLASGLEYRYLARIGSGDLLKYPLSQSTTSGTGLMAHIGPLFKRDTFVMLTLLGALAGQLQVMLVVFALGAVGVLFGVLSTELRLRRERAGD